MDFPSKLDFIMNHYGMDNQLKQFHSEVYELIEAINKKEDTSHIAEEIADILVMIEQFIMHYNIHPLEIQEMMKYKADRQVNRIRGLEEE